MGTNTDQTPAQRKAEARAVVVMASARRKTYGTVDDELRLALDGFERACIAEAVAPALNRIDERLGDIKGSIILSLASERGRLELIRKLLAERAGT
jgi:hypothetical protein